MGAGISGGGFDGERQGRGRPATRLLSQCLPEALRSVQDPLRDAWPKEVYRRLAFPWPIDSALAKREIGSFTGLYDEMIVRGIPERIRLIVLDHDLVWAEKNGRSKRHKKRGAMFCLIHNKRLAKYLAMMGPAGETPLGAVE